MVEVQFLAVKLSFSDATVLTVDDLEYIKTALGTFIAQVRLKVPESEGRNGTLESCEQLLTYFSRAYLQA